MSEDALRGLPGEPLMRRGLADARDDAWTPAALLVAIAPTRLRELDLEARAVLAYDLRDDAVHPAERYPL